MHKPRSAREDEQVLLSVCMLLLGEAVSKSMFLHLKPTVSVSKGMRTGSLGACRVRRGTDKSCGLLHSIPSFSLEESIKHECKPRLEARISFLAKLDVSAVFLHRWPKILRQIKISVV